MLHYETLEKYSGSLAELAVELGDLRYDALAAFLHALSQKLEMDAVADSNRGRVKLASVLLKSATDVKSAASEIERANENLRSVYDKF
ncbi:hypothetical protein NIES4071_53080 [Calothrix sp. NIES-4071]|nr:hypothetical protein NIES4071_53080 [Calothrix sp. NIES-4071]BAZ59616.1 hypothetical protein NIES4105_53030 [Calothrix sp. NIES-4105]